MLPQEIIEKIEEFEVFQCGLYHEKVKIDTTTKLPVKSNSVDEDCFSRVNLCDSRLRRKRLGCAHSSANYQFNNLINSIGIITDDIKETKDTLNATILKIYQLDHKKGDLEKEFAKAIQNKDTDLKKSIQNKISNCIKLHKTFMNTLNVLKTDIIRKLNAVN